MIGKILYITDDNGQQHISELRDEWQKHGFELFVTNIESALADNKIGQYIMVALVIDVKVNTDFIRYLRIIRELTNSPVVFMPFGELSHQQEISAYYAGADQIVQLPREALRVVAACLAQIRRYTELNNRVFTPITIYAGHRIFLDIYRYCVFVNGIEIELHKKEYKILKYLMKHTGRIMTYEQIICKVWGEEYIDDAAAVHTHQTRGGLLI